MAQHISYPSIEQYRNVIRTVKERAKYHNVPLPELAFIGTVKLHGTNASVAVDTDTGEMWAQSRNNVITPEADNAGFARFVHERARAFRELVNYARTVYGLTNFQPGDHLVIYGEWCGQGIQSGVGVSQVPKMFVIFGIRVKHDEDNSDWFTRSQILDVIDGYGAEAAKTDSIYCIHKFKTWTMEIDFAHPELVQNELGELTMKVEQECPVSKTFGVSGVGEGIVWTAVPTTHVPFRVSDLIFKVKGEKHSETKVHTLAPVDVERINNIRQLVETIVTDHRLEKKLTDMVEQGFPLLVQNTSVFLKIVGTDVSKEEGDTIDASGLPRKEVMAAVSKRASQWFVKKASEA